jgi:hypothetical protein
MGEEISLRRATDFIVALRPYGNGNRCLVGKIAGSLIVLVRPQALILD